MTVGAPGVTAASSTTGTLPTAAGASSMVNGATGASGTAEQPTAGANSSATQTGSGNSTAGASAGGGGALSASFSTLSKPILAPYYVYFGNTAVKSLPDAATALGMKAVTLGLAVAPKGSCSLTTDLDSFVAPANSFISGGGALALSFGGNLEQQSGAPRAHVQQACTDAPSLAKLIQSSMQKFSTHNIEFDIEGDSLTSDTAAAARLATALATVKKALSDTHITYTVATGTTGMTQAQLGQLNAAKTAGVKIDVVMLMTFDMGVQGSNAAGAQSAIKAGAGQVATALGVGSGDAMGMMGLLPMIGKDDEGATTDLKDATTRMSLLPLLPGTYRLNMCKVGQFASTNKLAILSFWSFNRDFAGPDISTSSGSTDQTSDSQFFTTFQKALGGGGGGGTTASASGVPAAKRARE